MSAYIFVHFTGEEQAGEQIYFAVSRDGLHWRDLNGGKPVLESAVGEKGVRDPFLVRHPRTGMFYLIATDLCMHTKKDWKKAVHEGSRDMIIWESKDLASWSKERAYTIGIPEAGCVWAPEAVYDEEKQAFMVFFASFTPQEGNDGKHIIYSSYTGDFVTFTRPERYIEREKSIIDTTIIKSREKYYRFSKDEATGVIGLEAGSSLRNEDFVPVSSDTLSSLKGLEGPECYRLPGGKWCLIADQFLAHKGYLPIVIDNLDTGEMHVLPEQEYDLGKNRKRHGGVMEITDEEYEALIAAIG